MSRLVADAVSAETGQWSCSSSRTTYSSVTDSRPSLLTTAARLASQPASQAGRQGDRRQVELAVLMYDSVSRSVGRRTSCRLTGLSGTVCSLLIARHTNWKMNGTLHLAGDTAVGQAYWMEDVVLERQHRQVQQILAVWPVRRIYCSRRWLAIGA